MERKVSIHASLIERGEQMAKRGMNYPSVVSIHASLIERGEHVAQIYPGVLSEVSIHASLIERGEPAPPEQSPYR